MRKEEQNIPKIYRLQDFKHLKRISLEEADEMKLKLLGRAEGANFSLCLHEGILHCKDFISKVKYFTVISAVKKKGAEDKLNSGQIMNVNFYEGM